MKNILLFISLIISISGFGETLNKIAENTLSPTIKVFTYKVENASVNLIEDTHPQARTSLDQQTTIEYFLTIEGVSKVNYDKATGTYTVVAKPTTNIPNKITL